MDDKKILSIVDTLCSIFMAALEPIIYS